jgi:hypothetical protein
MQIRPRLEAVIEDMLDGRILLDEALEEFEKLYIQKAFARNKKRISNTAEALGIHRNTISKRVNSYRAAERKHQLVYTNGKKRSKIHEPWPSGSELKPHFFALPRLTTGVAILILLFSTHLSGLPISQIKT